MGEVLVLPEQRMSTLPTSSEEGKVIPLVRPELTHAASVVQEEFELDDERGEQPRTCLLCEYAAIGPVTYCTLYKDEILFESVEAMDCPDFTFDDDGALTWGD